MVFPLRSLRARVIALAVIGVIVLLLAWSGTVDRLPQASPVPSLRIKPPRKAANDAALGSKFVINHDHA